MFFFASVAVSERRAPAERARREHRAGPGAEVLGREVLAGDLAQVGVHVGRVDRLPLAVVVDVLEQLVARQVAAALDDARRAAVVGGRSRAPCRSCRGTRSGRWTPFDRRRGGRAASSGRTSCSARVLVVADADQRLLEQLHDRGEHLLARQAGAARGRARSLRGSSAAPRRTRSSGRTWSRRAPRASAGGSGTACGPCASRPVAWRWPFGDGQIQTSVQAGGIASLRIRASVSSSLMTVPSGALKTHPSVAISRRIPGETSVTYRSPAARADPTGSTPGPAVLRLRVLGICRARASTPRAKPAFRLCAGRFLSASVTSNVAACAAACQPVGRNGAWHNFVETGLRSRTGQRGPRP